jgi:hypothetical protein
MSKNTIRETLKDAIETPSSTSEHFPRKKTKNKLPKEASITMRPILRMKNEGLNENETPRSQKQGQDLEKKEVDILEEASPRNLCRLKSIKSFYEKQVPSRLSELIRKSRNENPEAPKRRTNVEKSPLGLIGPIKLAGKKELKERNKNILDFYANSNVRKGRKVSEDSSLFFGDERKNIEFTPINLRDVFEISKQSVDSKSSLNRITKKNEKGEKSEREKVIKRSITPELKRIGEGCLSMSPSPLSSQHNANLLDNLNPFFFHVNCNCVCVNFVLFRLKKCERSRNWRLMAMERMIKCRSLTIMLKLRRCWCVQRRRSLRIFSMTLPNPFINSIHRNQSLPLFTHREKRLFISSFIYLVIRNSRDK